MRDPQLWKLIDKRAELLHSWQETLDLDSMSARITQLQISELDFLITAWPDVPEDMTRRYLPPLAGRSKSRTTRNTRKK